MPPRMQGSWNDNDTKNAKSCDRIMQGNGQ